MKSAYVGVQQGEKWNGTKRAGRDLNNKRDLLSPDAAFDSDTVTSPTCTNRRLASVLFSPLVSIGNTTSGYGRDDAVDLFTFAYHCFCTWLATFVLCFIVLGGYFIMGYSGLDAAHSAIYLAILYGATYYAMLAFWPIDRRMPPNLNPSIEIARIMMADNLGIFPAMFMIGLEFAGAALAGSCLFWLGWHQYGAACAGNGGGTSVAGTWGPLAGCTPLVDILGGPLVNASGVAAATPYGASVYGIDFLLVGIIVAAYIFPKKFTALGEKHTRNWSNTASSLGIWTFACVLFGSVLGFRTLNPAMYFAAGISGHFQYPNGFFIWDVVKTDGLLDCCWFIIFRMFVPATCVAVMYYGARGMIKLSEMCGRPDNMVSRRAGGANQGYESSDATASTATVGSEMSVPRSSGLRNRSAQGETTIRTPLITDYN